jgi:hypothetical protein
VGDSVLTYPKVCRELLEQQVGLAAHPRGQLITTELAAGGRLGFAALVRVPLSNTEKHGSQVNLKRARRLDFAGAACYEIQDPLA